MLRAPLAAGLLVSMLSCGGIPRIHYYVLEPRHTEAARSDEPVRFQGREVVLGPVRVLPPYDDDRIVFREGASDPELGFYHYHRWAAPLVRMLPPLLEALWGLPEDSARSRNDGAGPPLELRAILWRLEELDLAEGPVARVDLECALQDPLSGQVLWRGRVEKRVRARKMEMRDIVAAMAQAVAGAADELAGRSAGKGSGPSGVQGPS